MQTKILACLFAVTFAAHLPAQSPDARIDRLKAPDAKTRRLAAESLGKDKAVEAIPALARLLGDDDTGVRDAATDALVQMGEKAVPALAQMGEKAVPALAAALSDSDGTARLSALTALAKLGPLAKGAQPALQEALKHKTVEIRIRAAVALGEQGAVAKPALPALFTAAKDTGNVGQIIRFRSPSSVADAATCAALKIDPKCIDELAKAVVPSLIAALKDGDDAVLMAAGYTLTKFGTLAAPAIPALKEAQKRAKGFSEGAISSALDAASGNSIQLHLNRIADVGSPLKTRVKAVRDLGWAKADDGKHHDALIALCKDREPAIRAAAVEMLRITGCKKKAAIPALLDLLGDEELAAASAAENQSADAVTLALSAFGRTAVPGLAGVLEDGDRKAIVRVRVRAAKALATIGIGARSVLPALETAICDRYLVVALESACAYVRAGGDPAKALPILKAGLKHDADAVVGYTVGAVERIGLPARELVPLMRPLLKHEDAEMRIAVAIAICKMGSAAKPAVPALAELLKSGNGREQYQIARALEELGPDAGAAVPALVERLKDLNNSGPHPVLVTLGNIGPGAESAVPTLVAMLKDERSFHRKDIVTALGKIGPKAKAAVPKLIAELGHRSEYNRAEAARALGGIGPEAREAVAALEKLFEDEKKFVRVWAAYALARIAGDAKGRVGIIVDLWKNQKGGDDSFSGNSVAFDAAQALDLLGADARPALDFLIAALAGEKTSAGTAKYAARALGHFPSEAGTIVPALVAVLKRPGEAERPLTNLEFVIEALGSMGPKASAAVPELKKLLDGESAIAESASKALARIEGK